MIVIKTCGGLGNQLFQYAAALEMAKKCHSSVAFDLEFQKKDKRKFELRKLGVKERILSEKQKKKIGYRIQNWLLRFYKKKLAYTVLDNDVMRCVFALFGVFFCTTNNPNCPKILFVHKNILLAGSFSNEKYFSGVVKDLRDVIKNYIVRNKLEITRSKVCVHIRRGDYIGSRIHEVCTDKYYYQAMRVMEDKLGKTEFLIFSDDFDYIQNQMTFDQKVSLCEERNTCKCLGYMVQCKHFVLSNSSFSWWAQKLCDCKEKIVVAPNRWYNSNNNCDLYERDWIKIDSL